MRSTAVRLLLALALVTGAVVLTPMSVGAAVRGVDAKACSSCTFGYKWAPATKDINKGDAVKWRNPTGVTHNIRSRGSNWSYSKTIASGSFVQRRFRKRGTFRYRCSLHSHIADGQCHGMCGKIVV
jgi:plastocyanin